MNKLKINTGLAAVALLASLFSGWQTLLIVAVLMLLFCEITDAIKNVMIRVITFYFGIALFTLVWGLIVDGVSLVPELINDLVSIINFYLEEPISLLKLDLYLFNPILKIVSIADKIVDYLLVLVKFTFILAVLGNKPVKENIIVKKINEFVKKAISYINSFEMQQNYQQPMGQPMNQNFQQPMPAMQQQFVNQQTVGQNQMPNNINRQ